MFNYLSNILSGVHPVQGDNDALASRRAAFAACFEPLGSGRSAYSCDEGYNVINNPGEGTVFNLGDLPDDIVENIFSFLGVQARKFDKTTVWFPYRQMNLDFHRKFCTPYINYRNHEADRLSRLSRKYDLDHAIILRAYLFDMFKLCQLFIEEDVNVGALHLRILRDFGSTTDMHIRMPREACTLSHSVIAEGVWDGRISNLLTTCKYINFSRFRSHIELKSLMFGMLLNLDIAEAYNNDNVKKIFYNYRSFATRFVVMVFDLIISIGFILKDVTIGLMEWFDETDKDGVTRLEHFVAFAILACALITLKWLLRPRRASIPILLSDSVESFDDSRIIGERIDATGHSYILLHNNVIYVVKKDYNHKQQPQDEMALPGSDLYPSIARPVGAILVSNDGLTYKVVGCFFRYENNFVTARHVSEMIASGIAKVKISGVIKNKRGNSVLDDSVAINVEPDFFSFENNEAAQYTVDLFTCKLSPKQWAKLGVNKCGVRVNSKYGLCISVTGFQNGVLMTTNGKTLSGSGGCELHYDATTLKGFSGGAVFSGNSVVGMHYKGDFKFNRAIRRELITRFAVTAVNEDGFTSSTPSRISITSDVKSYGDPYEDYYGNHRFLGRDGSITSEYSDDEMDVYYGLDARSRKVAFGDQVDYEDEDYATNKRDSIARIEDEWLGDRYESAPMPPVPGCVELTRTKPVHCAPTGVVQEEAVALLDEFKDEILECGFDEETFRIPLINKENEVKSLLNHMKLWDDRVKLPANPPLPVEVERLLSILEARIGISYEPEPKYNSLSYITDVINTSAIKSDKSAGRPFQADGMATIGDVLKKYGPEQLAEIVLKDWREGFEYKLFLKNEPHKIKKIEAEMLRVITCMPVHKLIKNNCLFRNYLNKTSEAWREDSVCFYGFNPTIPNATEKLRKRFHGKILHGSDKTNWDFYFFGWIFDIYKQYLCRIVRKPREWTEEQFAEYKSDVCQAIDEVYKDCVYTTSNGRRFKQIIDGIMKSGWFMTIDANTFAQIVLNTLALMRCGVSDESILEDFDMVSGGDDDLASFPPGFDTDKYYQAIKDMGVDVEPDAITNGLIDNEFYSNTFRLDPNGVVSFHPVRFTKHIYKLRMNKLEDLPQALNSHMQNYCWSTKQFKLFQSMYNYVIKTYNLPDVGSRSMIYWRYKNKGLEIPDFC
jgi:hypothetical protein